MTDAIDKATVEKDFKQLSRGARKMDGPLCRMPFDRFGCDYAIPQSLDDCSIAIMTVHERYEKHENPFRSYVRALSAFRGQIENDWKGSQSRSIPK